jgi:signal transduction histidine kinase
MMRAGLRGRILMITVLTPLTLGTAAYITVHRNVQQHVDSTSIHENLRHSASVFESMLAVRQRALIGGGQVIAQDPRFFSLVMLGPSQQDRRFLSTVRGMARDFNKITRTDMFEVFDRNGKLLASVGERHSERLGRDELVKSALQGRMAAGVLVQTEDHYQAACTAVRADGRIVGALLLGVQIGDGLANELRTQMRSEVTFISDGRITGTTLGEMYDRKALLLRIKNMSTSPAALDAAGVIKVRGKATTYLTLVGRIPGASAGETQLYVMQRSYDPETAFLRRMQQDLGLLAALAVLGALFTGFVLSEEITRPIRTLVRGAQEMERGNFDWPVDVRNRDEIGYLAQRFREMRERERAFVSSLQEAARLKSEFISVASHELRTPISVIQGYRDLLADGSLGAVEPRQHQALSAIADCLRQLTQVAEAATHVAQVEGERIVIDRQIYPVVSIVDQSCAQALSSATGRKIELKKKVADNVGQIWLDPQMMTQAMVHLVTNAIRFTPDGGKVEVKAAMEGDHLTLQVRDTGIGIEPDKLRGLFDRSLLLRDSREHHSSNSLEFESAGLGFGLAIVRGIVEAHGGTVSAESKVNKGSTFTLRIPRFEPKEHAAAA